MAHIEIDHLSIEEKLALMEALWDDLSKRANVDITPAWHHEVLAERDAAFRRGEIQSEDWEAAKQRILRETS